MNRPLRLTRPQELDSEEAAAFDALAFEDAEPDTGPLGPGTRIADFEIAFELGRGAFGIVYAARQISLDRRVALKLIPVAHFARDGEEAARLAREARLLAQVRDPAIVAIYDTGVAAGFRYVAMELIEGTTLRKWLTERARTPSPSPESQIEAMFRIASALAAIHDAKIIHRDVKPENVLVDSSGRVFLADFGLARVDNLDDTVTEGFFGTLRYSSPEQTRGDRLTSASDIFSFGATAFEMLTGVPAFARATRLATIRAIELDDPEWPRATTASRDLRAIVERCLEKDAARRYPSGRELREDLERLRRFEPVEAVTRSRFARLLARIARRRSLAGTLVSAVIALVALGMWGQSIQAGRSSRLEHTAQLALARAAENLARGEHAATIELLSPWVDDPRFGLEATSRLAEAIFFSGDRLRAAPYFDRALERGSTAASDRLGSWIAKGSGTSRQDLPNVVLANARDRVFHALALASIGEFVAAESELGAALDVDPTRFDYRVARAGVRERIGRPADALVDYRIAREIRPVDRSLIPRIARVLTSLNRAEESELLLSTALETASDHPNPNEIRTELGMALVKQGNSKEALEVVDAALATGDDDIGLLQVRIIALAHLSRLDEAEAILADALTRSPDHPRMLLAAAAISRLRFDWPGLERTGRRLAETATWPWSAEGSGQIAFAAVRQGRPGDAVEIYDRLLAESPFDVRWLRLRGHALFDLGRIEDARRDVEKSLEYAESDVSTLYLKARIERRLGDPRSALFTYERALGLEPERGETYHWIADTWFELGNPSAGTQYALIAVEKHPNWFDAWVLAALCAYHSGDMPTALTHYDKALALRDHPHVRADRAEVLHLLGRDVEALAQYEMAFSADPQLSIALTGMAAIRLDAKDPAIRDAAEAIRLLERALEIHPEEPEYRAALDRARLARESGTP